MTEPTYPLRAPEDDPRFTIGLTIDIADVLTRQGYPPMSGADLVKLKQALFGFLCRQDATHAERAATTL